jgi:hypothetical protein
VKTDEDLSVSELGVFGFKVGLCEGMGVDVDRRG